MDEVDLSWQLLELGPDDVSVDVTPDSGPSDKLPQGDGSVQGYRAAGLLQLLADPRPTIEEAWRVLRPGGRIVLAGRDDGFLLLVSDDEDLTDVIELGLESRSVSPRAARSYRDLLLDQGFRDVEVTVHTEVITDHQVIAKELEDAAAAAVEKALITQEDADGWLAEQAERGRRGRFLAIAPTLLVTATR
jgi:SAM-dependent methyltransferase